ncbi:MAG: helix-turn-helix domain-containing protein [Planctomycetes bacterium]|nr:helix-turn-helix domain-containing protein [Planctomycetota bacterium]
MSEPILLTKREAAHLARVSERTLDRLVASGKFPAPIRIGTQCRWERTGLMKWLYDGAPAVNGGRR